LPLVTSKGSLAKGLLSLILLLYSISLAQKIEDPIAGFWALLVFYSLNLSLIYGTFDEQRVTSLLVFSALSAIVLPAIFLDLKISLIWLIYFLLFVSISLIRKRGMGKKVIIPIAVMLAPLPFYFCGRTLPTRFLVTVNLGLLLLLSKGNEGSANSSPLPLLLLLFDEDTGRILYYSIGFDFLCLLPIGLGINIPFSEEE